MTGCMHWCHTATVPSGCLNVILGCCFQMPVRSIISCVRKWGAQDVCNAWYSLYTHNKMINNVHAVIMFTPMFFSRCGTLARKYRHVWWLWFTVGVVERDDVLLVIGCDVLRRGNKGKGRNRVLLYFRTQLSRTFKHLRSHTTVHRLRKRHHIFRIACKVLVSLTQIHSMLVTHVSPLNSPKRLRILILRTSDTDWTRIAASYRQTCCALMPLARHPQLPRPMVT